MPAGDIPEVQAEIEGISVVLAREWRREARVARDELIRAVIARQGTVEDRQALVVAGALLALFLLRVRGAPYRRRARKAIRAAAARLLRFGATTADLRRVGPSSIRAAAAFAVTDLTLRSRLRLEGTRAERILKQQIAEAVSQPAGEAIAPFAREMTRRLTDPVARQSDALADVWAYRQHARGRWLATRSALHGGPQGRAFLVVLRARATLDDRTTDFCRWVHGKVLKVERIDQKLSDYESAVRDGDLTEADKLWPMWRNVTRTPADIERFRRHLSAGVGLPPFHWRCRTLAVTDRLEVEG